MDWIKNNVKIENIMTTAQTGAQILSSINQIRQSVQQQNGNGNGEQVSVHQSQQIALTAAPRTGESSRSAAGLANQNLHGDFTREFLKEIYQMSPTLIEEPRPTDGCTPLLCAVKCNSLNSIVLLLSCGAKVNAVDLSGNTSLHHAVMAKNAQIVKLLLIFRANLNVANKTGRTPTSLKTSAEVAEILRLHQQPYIYVEEKGKEDFQAKIEKVRQDFAIQTQKTKTPEQKAKSARLLSLDGGGIRGLVLIQMLMEMEEILARDGQKSTGGKTFVQKNFDWIGGTSTGGILALALADGTHLIDCLRLYFRLKDEIFGNKKIVGYPSYDANGVESFLKKHFGEDRKMAQLRSGKIRVLVTTTKAEQIPSKLALFRNYRSPQKVSPHFEPDRVPIWKAARCTSAAPTYFSSLNGLMDGGLMANNPGGVLFLEAIREIDAKNFSGSDHFGNIRLTDANDLAFLLSLGTGKTPEVPVTNLDVDSTGFYQAVTSAASAFYNLKSILIEELASSDGQVVEATREMAHNRRVPYFRMTPSLAKDIQLDTIDNNMLIDMLWTTKIYIRSECAQDMRELLDLMRHFERTTD